MRQTEDLRIGQLLMQACRLTGERLRGKMEEIGIHWAQGFVLMHLWHHDGVPQTEIARARHIRPATVTSMLQRMERDGWIHRKRDADDQRVVRVHLTLKAKQLHAEARDVFREMEEEFSGIYTDEERATLHRLLLKLHDRFAPHAKDDLHHEAFFHHIEDET